MPDFREEDPVKRALLSAQSNDLTALAWLIEHFSPALISSAYRRIGGNPRLRIEPEDLVQDVWAVFIRRMGDLKVTEERAAPLVMSFLTGTMSNETLVPGMVVR